MFALYVFALNTCTHKIVKTCQFSELLVCSYQVPQYFSHISVFVHVSTVCTSVYTLCVKAVSVKKCSECNIVYLSLLGVCLFVCICICSHVSVCFLYTCVCMFVCILCYGICNLYVSMKFRCMCVLVIFKFFTLCVYTCLFNCECTSVMCVFA